VCRPADSASDLPTPSATGLTAAEVAAELGDSVLFPAVLETDRADAVPVSHLDALASAGLYGLAGPTDFGGLDLEAGEAHGVIENLASGCLTTTFVWLQHHASVRAVAVAGGSIAEEWLRPLCQAVRDHLCSRPSPTRVVGCSPVPPHGSPGGRASGSCSSPPA
jgi:alkylation response protein AidB-like acyl-CoA dehydrogenase